jgi:hypothetical protein
VKRSLVAILGMVLGCNLDANGQGDGSVSEGEGTAGTTLGDTSETSDGPDPSVGTQQGTGSTSGGAIDDSGSTSDGGSPTTGPGATEDTSSGEGSSTGEPPAMFCSDRAELAGCWDFADVGSGMLWDGSGNGNHGTAMDVTVVAGPFGEAAEVDDGSEIAVPDSASLDIDGAMTLEAWVRVDAVPGSGRVAILDKDGQYSLMIYADQGYRCNMASTSVFLEPVGLGAWTHLACTYDGAAIRIYVDGNEQVTEPASGPVLTDDADPMGIGDNSPEFNEPLDGAIGGVRVWSRALDPTEVCEAAGASCGG